MMVKKVDFELKDRKLTVHGIEAADKLLLLAIVMAAVKQLSKVVGKMNTINIILQATNRML